MASVCSCALDSKQPLTSEDRRPVPAIPNYSSTGATPVARSQANALHKIGNVIACQLAAPDQRPPVHPGMVDPGHRAKRNRRDRILGTGDLDAISIKCDEIGDVAGRENPDI